MLDDVTDAVHVYKAWPELNVSSPDIGPTPLFSCLNISKSACPASIKRTNFSLFSKGPEYKLGGKPMMFIRTRSPGLASTCPGLGGFLSSRRAAFSSDFCSSNCFSHLLSGIELACCSHK